MSGGPHRSSLNPMLISSSPTAFLYVECDIPAGQTLSDWRRANGRTGRPTLRQRLLRTGR
jgi:hypothetical protein